MESNVKHEFTLPEWKENSRGNPYGQPHLVLFGSQNYHLCSMQYEMIDYHRTVARQGPTQSRFTMIYVTLCNYACLCQCFHVFFEEICQHRFPPTSPTSPRNGDRWPCAPVGRLWLSPRRRYGEQFEERKARTMRQLTEALKQKARRWREKCTDKRRLI